MVVVVRERLVTVDVPNDNRKRLGPTAGVSKPDSISNGITEESSDGTFATSSTGSLLLFFKNKLHLIHHKNNSNEFEKYFSEGRNEVPSLLATSSSL